MIYQLIRNFHWRCYNIFIYFSKSDVLVTTLNYIIDSPYQLHRSEDYNSLKYFILCTLTSFESLNLLNRYRLNRSSFFQSLFDMLRKRLKKSIYFLTLKPKKLLS
jgi:hypothetical protein